MPSRNSKGQFSKVTPAISAATLMENPISFRDLVALEAFKIFLQKDPGYPTHCAISAYSAADTLIAEK